MAIGPKSEPIVGSYDHPPKADAQAETKSTAINENAFPFNRLKDFTTDPWLESSGGPQLDSINSLPELPKRTRILIVGAGYGGLLFAVRLLQSGFALEDILLVDSAGGFGGTWYWNRYPGLMCDIESYIYMPLLGETEHIPTRKYVTGEELRTHAERIAEQWELGPRTLFRTTVSDLAWDEDRMQWIATASCSKQPSYTYTIDAGFVILANGTLSKPKVPDLPGVDEFAGRIFHTARWDYEHTGGSPAIPAMDQLKTKRVGVIGTGSTAVQVIPQLARWAGELTVFQRTPGAVGLQENRETDHVWWKENIQLAGPEWQRKRCENFNAFITNPHPESLVEEDLVKDGWTKHPSFSVALGGSRNLQDDFLDLAIKVDKERRELSQRHINSTVRDPATAEALFNPTYGWCKRPCFHQGYFETYNQQNVKLVNTPRQGITKLTRNGIMAGDKEYEVDLIVLATGYELGSLCPANRAQLAVYGRGGVSMSQKWASSPATLHGVMTRGFPNLFFPGTSQAGVTANQSYMFDRAAEHIAYILQNACLRLGSSAVSPKLCIEPSLEAEELWAMETVSRAKAFAATKTCSAGSYTISARLGESVNESAMARHMPWGEGMASYVQILEEWRAKGTMDGLEIFHD